MPRGSLVRLALAATCGTAFAVLPPREADGQPAALETAPQAPNAVTVTPSPATTAPSTTTTSWYGYQIIAADALAGTLVFWGGGNNGAGATSAAALGVMLYVSDGAAIHALHHHPMRSLASVGLRVGAPLVGALILGGIGALSSQDQRTRGAAIWPPWFVSGLLGSLIGLVGAVVVDDVVLSIDEEPVLDATSQSAARPSSFTFSPTVAFAPDRAHGAWLALGVAGVF